MKIIFFGDSVTDAGRDRNDRYGLGNGYVKRAAEELFALYPQSGLEILNRGNGGDRTEQLLARIDGDIIAEKPDVVILEVGINDVWHRFLAGPAVSKEEFCKNYEEIVSRLKGVGAKIIILQPFVLDVEDKSQLRPFVDVFNGVIGEIATREKLTVIALDEIFRDLTSHTDPTQFAADGVHPVALGCRYIADLVVGELKKILA